jgi:hypothetical protein
VKIEHAKFRRTAAALFLGTIAASSAAAFEPIDGTLVIVSDRDDPRYNGLLNPGERYDHSCDIQIDFSSLFARDGEKSFSRLFKDVRTATSAPESGNALSAKFELRNINYVVVKQVTWGGPGTMRANVELELTLANEGKPLLSKRLSISEDIHFEGEVACGSYKAASVPAIQRAVARTIDEIVTSLGNSEKSYEEIADAAGANRGTDGLQGLQPLLATYRVSESEGVVRKKPAAKGSTVRKLGMGSIVQVIGKLPTGWLQVAKEGEAIGWIHEGSVQAMSVQQAPVLAAAPAKPGKPAPAPVAVPPAPTIAAAPAGESFPTKPVAVSFPRAKPNPDDIAVIIGNANYKATAKDIPDVVPAYADAEGMRRYAVQALGIKEENVIFIKDAKLKDMVSTFGTDSNPKGKLFNWVKPNQSNVFVFYSGHGAPNGDGSNSYLVPTDAEASLIDLSGYSLKTLYGNLGKLPAKSITVVLEACFSGASQSGMLVKNASPIYQKAMAEIVPANLTVISAGSGNQIASWEQDKSHGLFTKHYLLGMAGAADRKPYGNGDGKVATEELTAYLKGTMSYMAQRYYGREQTVQVATGAGR